MSMVQGTSWVARALPAGYYWYWIGVRDSDGAVVAVGQDTATYTLTTTAVSTDSGASWTVGTAIGAAFTPRGRPVWAGTQWVLPMWANGAGGDGYAYAFTSADGLAWTQRAKVFPSEYNAAADFLAANGATVVAAPQNGNYVSVSTDAGQTWTDHAVGYAIWPANPQWHGTDCHVLAGPFSGAPHLLTYSAGAWSDAATDLPAGLSINRYCFRILGGVFLVSPYGAVVQTSANGTAWAATTANGNTPIATSGSQFAYASGSFSLEASADGASFTAYYGPNFSGAPNDFNLIGDAFAYISHDGDVLHVGSPRAGEAIAPIELINGQSVAGLYSPNSSTGIERTYYIDVPEGATALTFASTAGTGDVDLYVKLSAPGYDGDWGSWNAGNDESAVVPTPVPGRYFVIASTTEQYAGVTLSVTHDASFWRGFINCGDNGA